MPDPRRDHRNRHTRQVHRGGRRVACGVQLDRPRSFAAFTASCQYLDSTCGWYGSPTSLLTTYSPERYDEPAANRSAAWRAFAVLSTDTSRSGSGSVRRDIADFGSFSTAWPPASTRLFFTDSALPLRSTSDQRSPAISPRRNPHNASSQAWPSRPPQSTATGLLLRPPCRCQHFGGLLSPTFRSTTRWVGSVTSGQREAPGGYLERLSAITEIRVAGQRVESAATARCWSARQ